MASLMPPGTQRNPGKTRRAAAPSYRGRNCLPALKGLFDPVLGEVVAEGALADPHCLRRVLLDASRGFQRTTDRLPLDPVEILPEVQRRDARRLRGHPEHRDDLVADQRAR